MTFLKMRDDASQKLPLMICACRCLCFLIHACRFSHLVCLGVVVREVSDAHLQIALYHLLFSPLPPSPPPPPLTVFLTPSLPESLITISDLFVFPPKPLSQLVSTLLLALCFLKRCHLSWVDPHTRENTYRAKTHSFGVAFTRTDYVVI